jgi:outer membrane lipoprotein SlyB
VRKSWIIAAAAIAAPLCLTPVCRAQSLSELQKGALAGTVLGAGSGAIVGAAVGHPAVGALVGGGVGLVGGAAIGEGLQKNENAERRTESAVGYDQREIEYQRREIRALQEQQQTE